MGITALLIGATILFAAPSASAPIPLDGLVAFDDAYRCEPSKDFDALLTGIIRWEELKKSTPSNEIYKAVLATPPVPAKFRKQFGAPKLSIQGDEHLATVPVIGTWQGVPLRSLVVVERAESEGGFYLLFNAPRERVHEAANKAGFRIPSNGSEHRGGEVMGVSVGVDTINGFGAIYCMVG